MKLEPPLSNLVPYCETVCSVGCCGIEAFSFSPINIASYVCLHGEAPIDLEIEEILEQLADIKTHYGDAQKIAIDDLNQVFSGEQLVELVDEITANTKIAQDLFAQSEARRYKNKYRAQSF